MCGIVGLFIKDEELKSHLGEMLSTMLITMTDRGPDSAGIAIYGEPLAGKVKLTLQSAHPDADFPELKKLLRVHCKSAVVTEKSTHAVVVLNVEEEQNLRKYLKEQMPQLRIMSAGESIEIYKEVGLPSEVVDRFSLRQCSGSHGIGHTRMATESSVTTLGAHPFSTGADQCLVHNGSLSNHNNVRRQLRKVGMEFSTENDTEVAAAYISNSLSRGVNLGEALRHTLDDIDGFYTFVVGTHNGFGVLRDVIACKPAVMAETDQYVAFGSEYRALAGLPSIEKARVWEPEPATIYFWER